MPLQKQCSKCGSLFECKADVHGCWCEQLALTAEALEQLKNDFADCLCPQCLSAYATVNPIQTVDS